MMNEKNAGGRPSKLTPEVQATIVHVLSDGNTRKAAAEYAGVGYSTLRRWLRAGRDNPDGPFGELWAALKQKEAEAEIRAVATILKAAERQWQAIL